MSVPDYNLPPVGQITEDADVVGYLSALAEEARQARSEWEPMVEDNLTVYVYGQSSGPAEDGKIVVNEIQNAVIAQADVQTQEPIQVNLEPVETGEPPLYFWAGPQDQGIMFGLIPAEVADWLDPETGTTRPPVPLDEQAAGFLQSIAIPREASPALPPGATRPEWVVELDDKLVTDVYQSVYDVWAARSDVDEIVEENLLDSNVQGWAWLLFEYDENARRFILTHLPITQVYIDPTSRGVQSAAYALVDIPLDAAAARANYPDLIEHIDNEQYVGTPDPIDGNGTWGNAYNRDFKRPMVNLRVAWIRNQQVPLTKEEAIELGVVQEIVEPLPTFVDGSTPEVGYGQELSAVRGPETPAGDLRGLGVGAGGAAALPGDGGLNGVHHPDPAAGGAAATACILAATGQPVAPGDPDWPTRIGIRQVTQLGKTIVDDRECPFWDFPLLLNVNIPMPGQRPFGIGEPFRLKGVQEAESRTLTGMVEHVDYMAHPTTTMAQTTYDQLCKEYGKAEVGAGTVMVLPDQIFENTKGAPHSITPAPPMSPALPLVFETVKRTIEELSGHTDVMQGRSQAGDSGAKVGMLQQQGSGPMRFKARKTSYMLRRFGKLAVHQLRHLSVDELMMVVSRYPKHLMERIREKAQRIEWDVKVTVSSGAGQKMTNRQLAGMDLQVGAIGMKSYRERVGLDDALEEQRIESQMQKAARMGMVTAPGQEQGGGEKGGEKKSPPNNGA